MIMSTYTLYVIIEGPGDSEIHRSHWSFAFLRPNTSIALVYQVLLLDETRLIYQLDKRDGVPFPVVGSEGAVKIGEMDGTKYVDVRPKQPHSFSAYCAMAFSMDMS